MGFAAHISVAADCHGKFWYRNVGFSTETKYLCLKISNCCVKIFGKEMELKGFFSKPSFIISCDFSCWREPVKSRGYCSGHWSNTCAAIVKLCCERVFKLVWKLFIWYSLWANTVINFCCCHGKLYCHRKFYCQSAVVMGYSANLCVPNSQFPNAWILHSRIVTFHLFRPVNP